MTQPCKICRGTGHVECPAQTCAHWCSCTVCNGTGKVEVYEDWSQGFAEEKVKPAENQPVRARCSVCGKQYPEDSYWPRAVFNRNTGETRYFCADCKEKAE